MSGPRAAIQPFLAMEVAREASRRAAAGRDVVRFDVGQPCFGAPQAALDAAARALASDPLGYTEGLGSPALRRAIAAWYGETYGVDVSPERVVIAMGASAAFQLAFLATLDTGDRVAVSSPGYPPYRHILTALGFAPHLIADMRPEDLASAPPLRGVLIASPGNPTGSMLTAAEIAAFAQAARAHGASLISDEIYHGLTYAGQGFADTALAADADAVVINSFSKYWAMTGWRVGWLVVPERLVKPIERLAQNLFVAPPAIGQVAALAALGAGEECEARRAVYERNRALLLEALPTLGLPLAAPADGAFYVLLDVSAHTDDSLAFCQRLLDEADLALTPGVDFDDARGRRWVRLAYARTTDEVERGLARLARALRHNAA